MFSSSFDSTDIPIRPPLLGTALSMRSIMTSSGRSYSLVHLSRAAGEACPRAPPPGCRAPGEGPTAGGTSSRLAPQTGPHPIRSKLSPAKQKGPGGSLCGPTSGPGSAVGRTKSAGAPTADFLHPAQRGPRNDPRGALVSVATISGRGTQRRASTGGPERWRAAIPPAPTASAI